MIWNLDKSRPICPQICEYISVEIASGKLNKGEKLLSVREVALNAGVNPNTVQKAFEQLSLNGIIYSVRNLGWFVSDDITAAKRSVENLKESKTREYLKEMSLLGFDIESTVNYLKEWEK